MSMFDASLWLAPLDGDNPSGVSLRDDPRFHELERMIEPQVQVVRDDNNNPSSHISIPADWSAVLAKVGELRTEGRDLRLLVIVTRALANLEGLEGLTQGLTLITRTFDQFWGTMYPELRRNTSPQEAALHRTNALQQLQNEQNGLLFDLRHKIYFNPRGIGPITGRDLERCSLDERAMLAEAASGLNGAEKAELVAAHEQLLTRVRTGCAAEADHAEAQMLAMVAGAQAALKALDGLDAALATKIDAPRPAAPNVRRFLERVLVTLERAMSGRAPGNNGARQADAKEPQMPAGNGAARPEIGSDGVFPSRLSSRDDVIRCLDLVIAFYDRTEPSSPIPHLARRIRRMVPMDFIELMEDLAPSGLKEFRLLAGTDEARKKS